jgi:hypothetical protein
MLRSGWRRLRVWLVLPDGQELLPVVRSRWLERAGGEGGWWWFLLVVRLWGAAWLSGLRVLAGPVPVECAGLRRKCARRWRAGTAPRCPPAGRAGRWPGCWSSPPTRSAKEQCFPEKATGTMKAIQFHEAGGPEVLQYDQ